MQSKIRTLEEMALLSEEAKKNGSRVVQCHGVFDLLHPGHIRHFKEAKNQGTLLIVSVTPDHYVNKGPGRPAFNQSLRLETIAAIECVDYVCLNQTADASNCIRMIRPHVYVKGKEYQDHAADLTGNIYGELEAAKEIGATVHYTDDLVFSSSSLLSQFVDPPTPKQQEFLKQIKSQASLSELISMIESFKSLRVLIIGDAMIDEYQFTEPLGQSGKGFHMVTRCKVIERYLGGSLIIANHLAEFSDHVTLLTSVGTASAPDAIIETLLNPKIKREFIQKSHDSTLRKKRYVIQDGTQISKLFETYSGGESRLSEPETERVTSFLEKKADEFDLVLVADFGNGFTNPTIVNALSNLPNFLALNTQTNSGNRGFNVITHYSRADFISLNEPELRLSAHDRYSSTQSIALEISKRMDCKKIYVTQGVNGALGLSSKQEILQIPSLISRSLDAVGSGDSFFAVAALSAVKMHPLSITGFFGSIASAINTQTIGNKEPIKKVPFYKFLTRLLK